MWPIQRERLNPSPPIQHAVVTSGVAPPHPVNPVQHAPVTSGASSLVSRPNVG